MKRYTAVPTKSYQHFYVVKELLEQKKEDGLYEIIVEGCHCYCSKKKFISTSYENAEKYCRAENRKILREKGILF